MSSQEPPKKKSKQVENKQGTLLKRVKTYLRSTTGDSRLNHLMMLHVHKDRTDALTLVPRSTTQFLLYKDQFSDHLTSFPTTMTQ